MKDLYVPDIAVIKEKIEETGDVTTFRIQFQDPEEQKLFTYRPGQYVMVSVFGVGEIPISITSTPTRSEFIELAIKNVGLVSAAVHRLHEKDELGIRGPFGNGFPYEIAFDKHLLFVAGGIGLAPLRSLISFSLDMQDRFRKIDILYGSRTPSDLVFRREFKLWEGQEGVSFWVTVDRGTEMWKGRTGLVTSLFEEADVNGEDTVAFVCGPPVMIPFVIRDLQARGFSDEFIISTLERHMKCGVGKCGHCCIGERYICQDGPVYSYEEMKKLAEAW